MGRRLKKKFRITRAVAIAGIAAVAVAIPAIAENANNNVNLDVYELSMTDTDPVSSLEARYLESKSDDGLELINIDPSQTEFSVEGLDTTKQGLQKVSVKMTVVTTDSGNKSLTTDYADDILVKMNTSNAPQILLSSNSVTVENGSEFNASSYITRIGDISGTLPVLKIDSNVNTAENGDYTVSYTAVNKLGLKDTALLNVHVETSSEQLAAEQAAAEAEAAAQAQAEAEAAAEAEAQAQAAALAAAAAETSSVSTTAVNNGSDGQNPYSGGWSNCTWGAWEAAYMYTGLSLPSLGSASQWLYNAAATGYATGIAPAAGSIVVYSHHVAYVAETSADGLSVHIVEGGFAGGYNERWVSAYSALSDGQALQGYIYLS